MVHKQAENQWHRLPACDGAEHAHAMFLGGWLSFNGKKGKGGWGRTGLKDILPVTCLDIEDLRESTEGFTGSTVATEHPILANVDLETMPPILGYNIVKPRENCEVLATWNGTNDPLLAVGLFGQGKVLAYTSDPAPHWGCNFVYWEDYQRFWSQAIDWLVTNSPSVHTSNLKSAAKEF
ncbi:glutamine amidotransferase [Rhodopirellula bahusiensis]|uniref:glutamine amidotransferase n=1 Tax=Rhodopirellula bahusiensis TaxID=2014065 RepID=UPI003298A722